MFYEIHPLAFLNLDQVRLAYYFPPQEGEGKGELQVFFAGLVEPSKWPLTPEEFEPLRIKFGGHS
ncbi:MAG TPA: hypothetical protein VH092_37150 [Urbifossiella sp.]|nr:hypothetical protein [Urbifossiella sp.]